MITEDQDHNSNIDPADCNCPECSGDINSMPGFSYWQAAGEFFGYPQCCIDEFAAHADKMQRPTGVRKEAALKGFVPCERHSREILAGTVKHEDLIKDRMTPVKFTDPEWMDSYSSLLLNTTVLGFKLGIPKNIIQATLQAAHMEYGDRAMAKLKEEYDESENQKREIGSLLDTLAGSSEEQPE